MTSAAGRRGPCAAGSPAAVSALRKIAGRSRKIELTEDPAELTGWRFAANSRKSSATLDCLTTGKRYWFRVTAEGAAGPGPASNAATKVTP